MKRLSVFIAIFLVAVLCVPSVHSYAFNSTDIKVHTRQSVSEAFETLQLNNIAQNIYNFVPSSTNWNNPSRVYDKLNILPSSALNYSHYVLIIRNGNLQLLCFNGDSSTIFVNTGGLSYKDTIYSANDQSTGLGYINIPVVNGGYSYMLFDCAWSDSSQWSGQGVDSSSSDRYYSIYFGGTILSTNIPLYFYEELNMNSIQHTGITAQNLYTSPDLYNQLTDFSNANLPYVDGDGNIVDPTPVIESNKNHMYFKDCEIGFCYPKNSSSPASFGGAYFYIKYQVDDWIVNHISDYDLVFYADCEVGNDLINTTRYQIALDPDGCITIPFNRLWTTPLNYKGFSVLVTDKLVEDNFYKAYLYSLSASSFVDFGSKTSSYSGDANIVDALGSLLSGNITSFLYYTYDTDVDVYTNLSVVGSIAAQKYNPFLIDAFTLLTSGEDNSGLFEMEFDLVAGTEDVTDTSGIVNPDPFIPDDSTDPDFTPPAPSPGNSTTPSIIVNTGGTWSGVLNGVIGFNPGYTELKNDINANPDANFTQYLAPFKDNESGEFVTDFLEDMPAPLTTIFVGGFGVLTLLGIYRFIRRG